MVNFTKLSTRLKRSDNNTPFFCLENKFNLCKVVEVSEGNTCSVILNFKGELYKWIVKLETSITWLSSSQINLSDDKELDVSTEKGVFLEIKNTRMTRDYLKRKVMNPSQLVYIKCGKFDKYGRLLGKLFIKKNDTKSVNQLMIEQGYGYIYDDKKTILKLI